MSNLLLDEISEFTYSFCILNISHFPPH